MRALCLALSLSSVAAWSPSAHADSTSSPELSLAKSVVARYCNAWSETDSTRREVAVAEVWSERGEYLDSQPVHVRGREALAAEIVKFQQHFPGARLRCDAVRAHHGFVGYTWLMVMADGTERFRGMDFGEIDRAGRLVRIVSFFDMPQATE
jgi:hypothetical protein